ncbi:BLUF domain-containing protein [Marinifilum caeruleilacunae]|uniref:BLUF domain-containing protein n=1 Tax=Marinifilum caeruleilacunae TaxID=2499076 RepID=A0ABX1WYE7_9BACT|nr:BLUF domain-containing protein [Marinifilum caeruleilacunae]NOU60890.1 BLUF domain-containing protein [Marinifilum caeruleilacunae]
MPNLIHIVYVSFSRFKLSELELDQLLAEIRPKNLANGVTGLLLYNDEIFIQVIEGEQDTINSLYDRLEKDRRHTNIVKILEEEIKQRSFPDWSMGYHKLSKEESNDLPGYTDLMTAEDLRTSLKQSSKAIIDLVEKFMKYT